jgi:aminoglycoside phosphotransferase (APT) family kinase protein
MSPDDSALARRLERWLEMHYGKVGVVVRDLRRPSQGYSSETLFVNATWANAIDRDQIALVVRMAPSTIGTFRDYDLTSQWQAQIAAAAIGVPVADPVLCTDTAWLGAPFMTMLMVEGHVIGQLTHRDSWVTGKSSKDQKQLYVNFLATMTDVHRSDPSAALAVPRRDNRAELAFWKDYLYWSSGGDPVPSLLEGLEWCYRNMPIEETPPVLLWGDARFENAVFGDDLSLMAILDWDMTSVGAPEHDLAWFTSLDLTMHQLFGQRISGFPSRDETAALFEEFSGRSVRHLEWYETLAIIRSTAILTRISYLRRDVGEPVLLPIDDNPILDLLRNRLS